MQFRHAIGLRPLEAHDNHGVRGELARLERGFHVVLVMENPARRFDDMAFWRHCRNLDHAAPQIARKLAQAAGGLERIGRGAQDLVVQALRRARLPHQTPIAQRRFVAIMAKPFTCDGLGIAVQQPCIQQLPDHIGQAARRVEVVHIGQTVRVDLGHQRHRLTDFIKVRQIQQDARCPRHRWQVQHKVG